MTGWGEFEVVQTFVLLSGWIVALLVHRILRVLAPGGATAESRPPQEQPLRECAEIIVALVLGLGAFRLGAGIGPRYGLPELSIAFFILPFAIWLNLRRPSRESFLVPSRDAARRFLEAGLVGAAVALLPLLRGWGFGDVRSALLPDSTADALTTLLPLGADLVLAALAWRLSRSVGIAFASAVAAAVLTGGTLTSTVWLGAGGNTPLRAAALFVLFWVVWREVLRSRDVTWFLAAHLAMHRLA